MNCSVYKTNPGECMGSAERKGPSVEVPSLDLSSQSFPLKSIPVRSPGCLNPDRPGVANAQPSTFTAHVLRLNSLRQAGASFALADLTASEWLGLEALDDFKNPAAPVMD